MARNTLRTRLVERPIATRWAAAVRIAAVGSPLLLVGVLSVSSPAYAAEAPVGLGTAGTFSVLAGQTVTNTGPSSLSLGLGVSPGTSITGFGPPAQVGGATHVGDAAAAQAQSDLVIAYNDAAGRAPTAAVAGDLVGKTLTAGVYKSTGSLALGVVGGALTLDGQGDPNAVFIFQVASTLITASASTVNLINRAQACNIFWQVGTSVTLGTNSSFKGTVMALASTSNNTNAVIEGRLLVRNGQVSLDNNTFATPGCVTTPAPPPTASFTASATSGTAPLSVQLTDTSTGTPTSWLWRFGNGTTSTVQNPSVTYALAGNYTAALTASNASGASTLVVRTITVTAPAPTTPAPTTLAPTAPAPTTTAPAPPTTAPAPTTRTPAPTTTTTTAVGSTGAGRSGSGTSQLAFTGATPPLALAVVLLVLGVLLVAAARARTRSRRLRVVRLE